MSYTPYYTHEGRRYTTYEDKKQALLRRGFTLTEAIRMADALPQVFG